MRGPLLHALLIAVASTAAIAGESATITCAGQVVDARGKPVPSAGVTAYEHFWPPDWHLAAPFSRTITDADGRFVLTADRKRPKGSFGATLVATKRGHAIGWSSWWSLRQEHETVISLGRPAGFGGIVVDEAGSPIPGAEVRLYLTLGKGPLSQQIVGTSHLDELSARTDKQGEFNFFNVPADAVVKAIVSKRGYAHPPTYDVYSEEYAFAPGQSGIRIVLVPEARIEGVVVDRDTREPVAGVRLMVRPPYSPSMLPIVSPVFCVSGEDGAFSLNGLRAMDHVLLLRPELSPAPGVVADWAALPVSVSIKEPGEIVDGIVFEVTRGAILQVHVTEKVTGRPLESVLLSFSRCCSAGLRGAYGYFSCKTNERGIGLIRLAAARYEVVPLGYFLGGQTVRFNFQEHQPQQLRLQLEGFPCASGTVVDSEGNPVAGATVVVLPRGRNRAVSDDNGHFAV